MVCHAGTTRGGVIRRDNTGNASDSVCNPVIQLRVAGGVPLCRKSSVVFVSL